MYFPLEALEKALLADGRQVFRSLDKCFSLFADLASELGHLHQTSFSSIYYARLLYLINDNGYESQHNYGVSR